MEVLQFALPLYLLNITGSGALAMGGLAGGALVAMAPGRLGIHSVPRLLGGVAVGLAAIAVVLALPLPTLGTFCAFAAVGLSTIALCMCMSIVAMSYLQTESPGTLVGKVIALTLMLANCASPLGQLGNGVALDVAPAWAIAVLAAAMTAIVAAWLGRKSEEPAC